MNILAVDPGLATCGWSVVQPRTGRVIDLGVILLEADPGLGKNVDRVRRITLQAEQLASVVAQHGCTVIVAEAMSFPPMGRVNAVASICLSWGALVMLATTTGAELRQIQPKTWQRAIVPAVIDESDTAAIDYEAVFKRLDEYTRDGCGGEQLAAIPKRHRNHALDAVGVGVYAALISEQQQNGAAA